MTDPMENTLPNYESSWNNSDYNVIISSDDDEFEVAVGSKKMRAELEREALNNVTSVVLILIYSN